MFDLLVWTPTLVFTAATIPDLPLQMLQLRRKHAINIFLARKQPISVEAVLANSTSKPDLISFWKILRANK